MQFFESRFSGNDLLRCRGPQRTHSLGAGPLKNLLAGCSRKQQASEFVVERLNLKHTGPADITGMKALLTADSLGDLLIGGERLI